MNIPENVRIEIISSKNLIDFIETEFSVKDNMFKVINLNKELKSTRQNLGLGDVANIMAIVSGVVSVFQFGTMIYTALKKTKAPQITINIQIDRLTIKNDDDLSLESIVSRIKDLLKID